MLCSGKQLSEWLLPNSASTKGGPATGSVADWIAYIRVIVKLPEPVHPDCNPANVHVPVMVFPFATVPLSVNTLVPASGAEGVEFTMS